MKVEIELNSRQNESGQWIPIADVYIHEGNTVRHIGWSWEAQEFESKEAADLHASLQAKHLLKTQGYDDEIVVLSNQTKKD